MNTVDKTKVEKYTPSQSLTFYIIGEKVLAKTTVGTFIIKYDHGNYKKQLERLKINIRQNKIKSPTELICFCAFRPMGGTRGRMAGLELVTSRLERHL